MSVTITFDTDGLGELEHKLSMARAGLMDRTRPHQKSRDYMKKRWQVNFDSDGAIYGAWKPHSPWTIILHGPHKLLQLTGSLRSGFFAQAASPELSSSSTVWNFQNRPRHLFYNAFGNSNPSSFAKMMNFGPVPARKLWGINGEDEEQLRVIFDNYCNEVIAKYL